MRPKVSVLIPSYNHAPYIADCIQSALDQTLPDIEVILVDDRSPDSSVSIATAIAKNDPRLTVMVNDENLGTYGTQQRALDLAQGEFVAVLNSDDLWAPDKLERQIAALTDHSECGFCYTLGNRVDAKGQTLPDDQHSDWPTSEVQELLPYLLQENRLLASSILYRREGLAFHAECRYSGDWVALLELASRTSAACVAEPLTFWRIHEGNSHRRSAGQLAEEIWLREAIRARKWKRPSVSPKNIREGLARNDLHLAALYVLSGSMGQARAAALHALGLKPSAQTAKRLVATGLTEDRARKRLWPHEVIEPVVLQDRESLEWH